jgi:hypothetical protein
VDINIDAVRQIHDGAVELGAECGPGCPFNTATKDYALVRAARTMELISKALEN